MFLFSQMCTYVNLVLNHGWEKNVWMQIVQAEA